MGPKPTPSPRLLGRGAMRVRTLTVLIGLFVAVLGTPAHAQDEEEPTIPREEFPAEGPVPIGDGYAFTGAVITPPDGGPTRTLDAYEAAVFVQSWLPQMLFANPDQVRQPAPDLPVYRVDIDGSWVAGEGRITVYYTTDAAKRLTDALDSAAIDLQYEHVRDRLARRRTNR